MARFSLSFISVFLLLAVLALSMPAQRGGQAPSQPLGLNGAINELRHPARSVNAPDGKNSNEKEKMEAKVAAKLAEKAGVANTPTPVATRTDESKPKFTGLGRIPLIGSVIGDNL
ncbi:uncharacterized protein N7500_010811 [Penicillium coprophilum]|uniref:uncharacterized protein n=1 Tax=Penicillium coprophilum TaxID=36646 RepID=UPI0023958C80|nr:uncharacterized protein N7500_010811 [Penicillium coprophilum]KAJ5150622.1 hypothetical protein N7500_010811 [Penicillium coprophilum]